MVKRYDAKLVNYYREHDLLQRLEPLPVPRVLPGCRPGELHLAYVDGVHGADAIEHGGAGNLLRELGLFLRRLHEINPKSVADILPGEGALIVHGDFAHYNCLADGDGSRLVAVLDWEAAHLGDRIEDLAWCEWQFRNRYPHHEWAVSRLFEGYGEQPDWELREQAIAARIEELGLGAARSNDQARHYQVMRFDHVAEAAAFVAALSRFLNSPQGGARPHGTEPPEVWRRLPVDSGRLELCLNDQAVNAAAAAFGHVRVTGVLFKDMAGTESRLLLGGGQVPSWGLEEAERELLAAQL